VSLDFWLGVVVSVPLSIVANLMTTPVQSLLRTRAQKAGDLREKLIQQRLALRADAASDADYRYHLEQRALERMIWMEAESTRADILVWGALIVGAIGFNAGWPPPFLGLMVGMFLFGLFLSFLTGKARERIRNEQDVLFSARLDALDARDAGSPLEEDP
jgi:hypothetical protein